MSAAQVAPPPAEESVACIEDLDRAGVLLQPLRLRIVEEAREPTSATEIAGRLDLTRQKVNYHVKALADAGFLVKAGQRKRRNMIEQRWVAKARSFVLPSQLLGPLGTDGLPPRDAWSASALLGLLARAHQDLAAIVEDAQAKEQRLATLSLQTDFRFATPERRKAFTEELQSMLVDLVARHTEPVTSATGKKARGRPFRLVLGCFPMPKESAQ